MGISKIGLYINEPKLYIGTFELFVFDVILGSFGILISKWPVTRKPVSIEKSEVKFGTQR